MASIADELTFLPIFHRTPAHEVRGSARLWNAMSLGPGERLWETGAAVDQLAVVVFGELAVEVDGVEVGRVMPGELLGEASAFFAGTTRSASLVARGPPQVLALPTHSLRTLRWERNGVYDALLDQGLRTLARRIRATDQKIACLALGGQAAPTRSEPSSLVRLWRAMRPGGPKGERPPLLPILRKQPGLRDSDPASLLQIAEAFQAEPVQEGEIIFLEGDPGAAAWVVGEGGVDVLRHVRGERAELLATLRPGDMFGINTLVEKGPRTASCVAIAPGWLYRLDAEAAYALKGDARLLWREATLAALATQIRLANAALNRASRAARPARGKRTYFQNLLTASGYLEALSIDERELAVVEVVVPEESERYRRPKRIP